MIFSNKMHKIASGTNISLFATSKNEFDYYIFNKNTQKKKIILSSILQCLNSNLNYNYNAVIKINSNHLCVCFDDNMSIIKNDED